MKARRAATEAARQLAREEEVAGVMVVQPEQQDVQYQEGEDSHINDVDTDIDDEDIDDEDSEDDDDQPQGNPSSNFFSAGSFYGRGQQSSKILQIVTQLAHAKKIRKQQDNISNISFGENSFRGFPPQNGDSDSDDVVESRDITFQDEARQEDIDQPGPSGYIPVRDLAADVDADPAEPGTSDGQPGKHGTIIRRRKLLLKNDNYTQQNKNIQAPVQGKGIILLPLDAVSKMASLIHCDDCIENEGNNVGIHAVGLDTSVQIKCPTCERVLFKYDPRNPQYGSGILPATKGLVSSCMNSGVGFAGFEQIVQKVNTEYKLHSHQYHSYKKEVGDNILDMFNNQKKIVNECVFTDHHERGIEPDGDGVLDVDVTFDGTWLTRGHSSNSGVSFVMDAENGFILDYEVLSKFCQKCNRINKKHEDNADRCAREINRHKLSGECLQNYNGSSGAMEKESALRIWDRSVETNAMRYTGFISDGDSSAYTALNESKPYGDTVITKHECVNHVAKRLGTHLRQLKKDNLVERRAKEKDGRPRQVSIGGSGKLTDACIDRLQGYYGKGIRDSKGKTVEEMRKACVSGFKHIISTDETPDHGDCQTGIKSHCFYNRALAKEEIPQSHTTMKVKCKLTDKETASVFSVYKKLTTDALLSKCIAGKTQNPNESLHGKLWNKLNKVKHHGLKTIQYVTAQTAVEHNMGYDCAEPEELLGLKMPTPNADRIRRAKELERIRHSITPKRKKKKYANVPEPDADYGPGQH
jgi:DNA-binding MarR family transcriptional regulator